MPHPMSRLGVACAVLLCVPALAAAQEARRDTPQISARELASAFATGRYMAPVHCTREDGSLVDLTEAVTVRIDPSSMGTSTGEYTLRATFFGIDVANVRHCQNLMAPRLTDRRGILRLMFRGQAREDLGVSYFRRELRDGEIEYHVQDGRLRAHEVGSPDPPVTLDYDDDDARLIMRELQPRSDPARMLQRFARQLGLVGVIPSYEFEVVSPEHGSFKMWVIKDAQADREGHRSAGDSR